MSPAQALAAVREQTLQLAATGWPALVAIADGALPDPLDPVALLTLAAGRACGAETEALVPVAAAVMCAGLGLRLLDDVADADNPHALHLRLGVARTVHAALALQVAALGSLDRLALPESRRAALRRLFVSGLLRVAEGQDEDLRRPARSLADYERVVGLKTVAAYELAALAGALAASDDAEAKALCRRCGAHAGRAQQILDDIEALWFPDGAAPASCERRTHPLLQAIAAGGPQAAALSALADATPPDWDRLRAALDAEGVRPRLLAQALDQRDAALAALGPPLHPAGPEWLGLWLDWLFRDGARLAGLG